MPPTLPSQIAVGGFLKLWILKKAKPLHIKSYQQFLGPSLSGGKDIT